jgi:hypothetical protein
VPLWQNLFFAIMSIEDFKMRNKFCHCRFFPSINEFFKLKFLPCKKSLLTLFFLVISSSIFAQKFEGGLLAGFNGSQVRGYAYSNGFHKLGFVGGAWVLTDISDKIYLSGEIKYNQKGSRQNPNKKNGYLLYVYRLNYIDMPLLIGYRYKDYLSFFGGVSFGYLMNSSLRDNYGEDKNYDGNLHSYEIGMFVGAKVDFDRLVERNWASKLTFDIRFQFSAMSIYNRNYLFYSPYGQFNTLISTSLYYTIDLGTGKINLKD